jgi:hypothetical protein
MKHMTATIGQRLAHDAIPVNPAIGAPACFAWPKR